jgi:hypothetical protein
MLGSSGVEGALDALAAKGFLVVFDPLSDPRFAPIPHPYPCGAARPGISKVPGR